MSKKLLGMGRGMGRGLARKPGVMANGNAGTNDTNTSSFNSSPGSKGEVDWGRTSPSAGINSSDGNSWNPVPDSSDSFSRSSNGGGDSRGRAGFSNGVGSGGGRQGGGSGGGRQGGGGGKGCFKCGEDGHMARDCPNADSSGSRSGGGTSGGCRKCGEEGHFARDCPQGGGGGGRDGCRKCGEEGHFARDCPQGGGGGGRDGCRKCGEEGHFARDCPQGGGGGGRDGCRKCGEDGHFARDCPQGGGGGGREKKGCFRCGEDGHMAKDCSQPPPEGEKPRENYIPPDYSEDENVLFGSNTVGINFGKYNEIPVEVSGHDPVGFISGFEEAGFYELCMKNVRKANYEDPTPVQKYAIPIIMAGRDLMACAQTGSGKTAAFVLPVITGIIKNGVKSSAFCPEQYPQAVIVAPTRELAVQINSDATKFAHGTTVRSVVVYGGTSVNHQKNQVSRGTNILVGTPGRLLDFIKNGVVNLSKVEYLILDEADRMLDMGFEPDIRRLVENPDMPPKGQRQTLMFSATFPTDIQKLAADFLNNYLFVTVGRVGGANTDVTQTLFEVERLKKRDQLCDILSDSGKDRVLVFVEQKRNADFLATYLSSKGFPTTSIHGDRLQREREEALRDFKSGEKPVLIATSVAARGLDIHDVKHVINYDLPSSIDEYVHRIGRTGRCGNLGRATSFFSADADNALASSLVDILKEAHQEVPDWLLTYVSGQGGGDGGYDSNRFASTDIRRGGGGYSKQSAFSGNDDCESWD